MIWDALLEFLVRLAFGLSLGLLLTPSALVPAGFFRVHLWVLLGMYTLAALFTTNSALTGGSRSAVLAGCIAAAIVCYVVSVIWLYERSRAGRVGIMIVNLLGIAVTLVCGLANTSTENRLLAVSSALSGSLVLGFVMAAMLLGHWYLNSPGMKLGPLRRLLGASAIALLLRAAVCGTGLFFLWQAGFEGTIAFWATIGMRWLAGIVGIAGLLWMTKQTLQIPNTQSATGILYVAVIFSFLGELASQLVSAGMPYPL